MQLAWTVANTNVSTAIFGASSLAQLEDNLGALDVLPKLSDPALMERIETILANKPKSDSNASFRTTGSPKL